MRAHGVGRGVTTFKGKFRVTAGVVGWGEKFGVGVREGG